ncbi:hypothetical protein [Streptomyces sp. NPDC005879]|uniref:hypothetical protein n=1 Tax=Streptomyces sp. NPDC005879 TaxID=3154567 RepID=UPI00340413B4
MNESTLTGPDAGADQSTVNARVNTARPTVNTDPGAVNTAADPAALWAAAQCEALPDTFPEYGDAAWQELPPADPGRWAAVLAAAEAWRRHMARERWLATLDDDAWQRETTREAADALRRMRLSLRPTRAERAALARPLAPHRLRATAGWPPVAVPGKPGCYLIHEPAPEAA